MKKILKNSYLPGRYSCLFLMTITLVTIQSGSGRAAAFDMDDPEFDYEPDGHYWTVLVVATLLKIQHAQEIAYSAEFPDNVINKDGYCVRSRPTFLFPGAQKKVHALTGGNPANELSISLCMLKAATTPQEIGTALHRLGDSFAHTNDKTGRMYPHLIGHTLLWKKPDKIQHNPNKYLQYVRTLITGFGGREDDIDMGVFHYIATANLGTEANSAILKAEYNIISGSIAFVVDQDQLPVVEKYLDERMSMGDKSYAIHSSTDGDGKNTTIVILTRDINIAKTPLSDPTKKAGILKSQAESIVDQ